MTNPPASEVLATWQALGTYFDVDGNAVFVLDVPPLYDEGKDPIFVLHGYPSCCYDWHHVLPDFGQNRRVVLFDYPGFGLSDKPNRRYSIEFYADAAERVSAFVGLESVVLVTHDLGDSVGGELLARDLDGQLAFEVSQRVITNGSIYMDLAQLSTGQQLLLGLDDAPVDLAAMGLDPKDGFKNGLGNTFSPAHPATDGELDAAVGVRLVSRRPQTAGAHDPLHRGPARTRVALHGCDREASVAARHRVGRVGSDRGAGDVDAARSMRVPMRA